MKAVQLSAFAADKGTRLATAAREQLHPLVNDKGLIAVQVFYLYEADGQMLAGSFDMRTSPGAGVFLEELARQRYGGALPSALKVETVHPQHKKS